LGLTYLIHVSISYMLVRLKPSSFYLHAHMSIQSFLRFCLYKAITSHRIY